MKNINRFSAIKSKFKTALLIVLLSIILVSMLFAQENVKIDSIRTSAQCEMCKERIENHLNKQEDILESVLEVETAICTVKYDSTKITIDDIRKEISLVGYDADDVKANKRAYNKLPKCCKKAEDR